jgi:hypothetical protein
LKKELEQDRQGDDQVESYRTKQKVNTIFGGGQRTNITRTPDTYNHPNRWHHQHRLGRALQIVFEETGDVDIIDESFEFVEKATESANNPHPPSWQEYLSLADALCYRYAAYGSRADLKMAKDTLLAAINLPDSHSIIACRLSAICGVHFDLTKDYKAQREGIEFASQAILLAKDDKKQMVVAYVEQAQWGCSHYRL